MSGALRVPVMTYDPSLLEGSFTEQMLIDKATCRNPQKSHTSLEESVVKNSQQH